MSQRVPHGRKRGIDELEGYAARAPGLDNEDDITTLSNIKIHPLLQMQMKGEEQQISESMEDASEGSVKRAKLSKAESRAIAANVLKSDWKKRDGFVVNPYLNQNDQFEFESELKFRADNRKRVINFESINEPGKQRLRGQELRERLRAERIEREKEEELKRLNLIPNVELGEDKYIEYALDVPPYVEWWDKGYLKNGGRKGYDERLGEDDEDFNISSYIHHPVPTNPPWTRFIGDVKPMFLTKKEQRKMRKNRRMIEMRDKQDRVKLGLSMAPEPKVKLKNLVNVLTNESIKNPTEVEMKVRQDIAERKAEHERMNLERKLNKEDKKEKIERKLNEDISKGIYSCVFGIRKLANPKHAYKVDMNAKQHGLNGVCVSVPSRGSLGLVIIEGGQKSVEKYRRLMMNRIDWTVNERKRGDDENAPLENLANNLCELIWEGEIEDFRFRKWSSYKFDDGGRVIEFLMKHGVDNYWKQWQANAGCTS
jgi:U4/U6 small nuclear ribonucleoprotein PRP3